MDPASGTDTVMDIVVRNMRIIDPGGGPVECPPERVIDAAGLIVVPGLIDFHTHLFHTGSTISVSPDLMIAQGVTAAVDAGSAGCANYEAFYNSVIVQSKVRVKGLLTVYSGGQLDAKLCEDFSPSLYNVDQMERLVDRYRDNILGLKIRLSRGVVPEQTGTDYLKACIDLAQELDRRLGTSLRVCVHTTDAPVPAGELAACLRPGDIFTHCFQGAGNTVVREDGSIDPGILKARARGVVFDSANGKSSFGLDTARQALAAGFLPDVISTDLTAGRFNVPPYVKSLPMVMSRYLALGMDLMEVLERVTARPAELMGLTGRIGTLQPGAYADIAILKEKPAFVIYRDFRDNELQGDVVLVPQLTMCAGQIQYCQADFYL